MTPLEPHLLHLLQYATFAHPLSRPQNLIWKCCCRDLLGKTGVAAADGGGFKAVQLSSCRGRGREVFLQISPTDSAHLTHTLSRLVSLHCIISTSHHGKHIFFFYNFEMMSFKVTYSLDLNRKWRIVFMWDFSDAVLCTPLHNLSAHCTSSILSDWKCISIPCVVRNYANCFISVVQTPNPLPTYLI